MSTLFSKSDLLLHRSRLFAVFAWAILLICGTATDARADRRCFTDDIDQTYSNVSGGGEGKEYILAFDRLLTSVLLRFFPDGYVCGIGGGEITIRIEGRNFADNQIRIAFLEPATKPPEPDNSTPGADDIQSKAYWRDLKYVDSLLRSKLSGTARKQLTEDLILWEGRLEGANGKTAAKAAVYRSRLSLPSRRAR